MATSILGGAYTPTPKRKVFVSYHHGGDQAYYNYFSQTFSGALDVLADRSLDRARDSNDHGYIMRYIRERHLTGASTMIVLCGAETPRRKYVDWEIHAGLNQGMSLLAVLLPTIYRSQNGGTDKPARLQDNIDSGYAPWVQWGDFIASAQSVSSWIAAAHKTESRYISNMRSRRERNG